jgi:hypothetical protein
MPWMPSRRTAAGRRRQAPGAGERGRDPPPARRPPPAVGAPRGARRAAAAAGGGGARGWAPARPPRRGAPAASARRRRKGEGRDVLGVVMVFLWWTSRKTMSSLLPKNKAEPYAARRDFNNAILCEQHPILSKKNNTEGSDDLDAFPPCRLSPLAAELPRIADFPLTRTHP